MLKSNFNKVAKVCDFTKKRLQHRGLPRPMAASAITNNTISETLQPLNIMLVVIFSILEFCFADFPEVNRLMLIKYTNKYKANKLMLIKYTNKYKATLV